MTILAAIILSDIFIFYLYIYNYTYILYAFAVSSYLLTICIKSR